MAYHLLEKLLNKRGLKLEALAGSEKESFDDWQRILTEGETTVEKIKEFCQQQLGIIDGKLRELDNSTQKNERLIIMSNVYKALLGTIEKPKNEREQLEKYLRELIEK